MAEVAEALDSIGASPKSPFGLTMPSADPAKRLGELAGERKAAQAKLETDSAGVQAKMAAERKAGADLQTPKLENVDAQFQHKGMSGEDMQSAMQTMFAFAALGGAMTRTPMTAALNAFSGAMKGFQQGDDILFKREAESFDRNLKVAMAKNQQAMNEYKIAFDKHRGNMQDLQSEWSLLTKKYGDTVAAINGERQDIAGMLKHMESMRKMDEQIRRTDQQFQVQMRRIDEMSTQRTADRESRERMGVERNKIAQQKVDAAGKKGNELGLKGKQLDSYIHNEANIEAIDQIIQAVTESPDALGFKTLIPGIVLNRADPEGTPTRAAIANLTSMTIKDRAGTAQTAQEMKNIAPFIPRDGDDAQTVMTKLTGMKREMKRMNDTAVRVVGGNDGKGGDGVEPYSDSEKEARYQQWKAKQK